MLFSAAVPTQVAVYVGRPADVRVVEHRRSRARVRRRRAHEDLLRLVRHQLEPAVLRIGVPVAADDQRRDADRVRRGHRRALDVLVVGAGRPLAVTDDERRVRRPVRVQGSLVPRDVERIRAEDLRRDGAVAGRAEEVAEVAAGSGDVDSLGAPVRVVGLRRARPDRADADDVRALGRHRQARVVHGPRVLGAGREVGADRVDGRVVHVRVLVPGGGDQRDAVLRAYWSARVVASMIVRCSSCCVAESAGLPVQL